ncbi:voltage-gated potassium channel [Xylaria sp. CBS 124048]|nr:voltage-gated potassium channel [Xylaria sp. CBS 124048]
MEDADPDENTAGHASSGDRLRGDRGQNEAIEPVRSVEPLRDPTRWWFATSAFPMIAGTLGPVASAFSICALVEPWRQHIPPGSDIKQATFTTDPPWLLAVNAIQLAIALIANLSLLLNMARRVRPSIAQPITIVGWYISSILLTALCASASGPLIQQPRNEFIWSQAFYYGLFAAVLYFLVATLMLTTVWGAQTGHYPNRFELTLGQRTLMLQSILFLTYLLLGALAFCHIENWLYLDAVYWADVTLFTVGFGDLTPKTRLGRGLMMPYALIGITTLGLVIGSIRSLILDRGRSVLDARMLEKKRRQFVRRLMRSSKGQALEPITEDNVDYYPHSKSPSTPPELPRAELKRRQNEFYLMRKIQDQASNRRRWAAMSVSTGSFALLWLVGAKIFQECEAPYQGWSYFDGIYFSFQAMTTIGYGDVNPESNCAKAFFVFWSLLSLPTLTILISHAGDTVVKEVRDTTVLLGNLTILPGDRGYKRDIRKFLFKLSCGFLPDDKSEDQSIRELPPGFLGAAQPHSDVDDDEDGGDDASVTEKQRSSPNDQEDNKGPSSGGSSRQRPRDRPFFRTRRAKHKNRAPWRTRIQPPGRRDIPEKFPETRAEYHLVLIDEIRRLSQGLQSSPSRKFTFQEWAWYLRLIGEDESDASTHRGPVARGQLSSQPSADSDDRQAMDLKWSWVGHHSPLMDMRDEAEWIIDRLIMKLRQELLDEFERRAGEEGIGRAANEGF